VRVSKLRLDDAHSRWKFSRWVDQGLGKSHNVVGESGVRNGLRGAGIAERLLPEPLSEEPSDASKHITSVADVFREANN
jgi:hypothetical protein